MRGRLLVSRFRAGRIARLRNVTLLAMSFGLAGCDQEPAPVPAGGPESSAAQPGTDHDEHAEHTSTTTFGSKGTVLWLEPQRVYLNHEAMPGFMDAMAMGFDVEDPEILEGLRPGVTVRFRVVVEGENFYIDQIFPLETDELLGAQNRTPIPNIAWSETLGALASPP